MNLNLSSLNKKQVAMLGALMGDALGVPHEFRSDHSINQHFVDHPTEITTEYKTYGVPLGVYSDDFSQQLCVNVNFSEHPQDANEFYRDLLLWEKGKYWVSGQLFDEGMQTASQLRHYARTGDVKMHSEHMSGNGSLMRILPIAFLTNDAEAMQIMAWQCSGITHNSEECIKSCQFYTLLARLIADQTGDVSPELFTELWGTVGAVLGWSPNPLQDDFGSGYVIDTLNIVKDCIENSTSFEGAIKRAILYGGDTDTNACVVGGIAALVFGLEDVSQEWFDFIAPSLENGHVQQLFDLKETA